MKKTIMTFIILLSIVFINCKETLSKIVSHEIRYEINTSNDYDIICDIGNNKSYINTHKTAYWTKTFKTKAFEKTTISILTAKNDSAQYQTKVKMYDNDKLVINHIITNNHVNTFRYQIYGKSTLTILKLRQ